MDEHMLRMARLGPCTPGKGPSEAMLLTDAVDGRVRMIASKILVCHLDECRSLPAGRREEAFEELLAGAGFAVERVPPAQLHEEYRDGEYRVLRAAKRDADPD